MRKLFALIFFCHACFASSSQEEFVVASKLLTRFNYTQLTGGIILLQGKFDSYPDTLNFILDTGSGGISLDSVTAAYFGLAGVPSDQTIRGIGGIKKVSFLNNRKLHFPGLTIDSLNFHINDYDILTAVYGEKIDGIIGYSVFKRYIIKLNYDSAKIEFWTKGVLKYPRGGFLLKPFISTLPVHSARITDARKVNSRFLIDIGAGLNLMLSTDFIRDSAFLLKKRKLYAKEAEGMGGKIDLSVTVLKELKIGPYRFRNVPVEIFDDTYNVTSYPYLSGIIGNDILRRFNVIVNYEKREIHLTPNGSFEAPFDYAYSGLALYMLQGKIVIGDVSRGSPAEKAGVKEGDVVIAVNKNFSQNMQIYKAAIQNAGQWLKLIVQRNGTLMEFNFKIGSIY
jgi:hypothetical protein